MTQQNQGTSGTNVNYKEISTQVRDRVVAELERKHTGSSPLTLNDVRQSLQSIDFSTIVREAFEAGEMRREPGAART